MNYKEESAVGSSWVRCKTIVISNPLLDPNLPYMNNPHSPPPKVEIYFTEEKVLKVNSDTILNNCGSCSKEFNPTELVPLLDVHTNEPTGETFTHMDLYTQLYSLYIQTATNRDATQASQV